MGCMASGENGKPNQNIHVHCYGNSCSVIYVAHIQCWNIVFFHIWGFYILFLVLSDVKTYIMNRFSWLKKNKYNNNTHSPNLDTSTWHFKL